jgi:hypothetical protein
MTEIWKEIQQNPKYEVSSMGRIRNKEFLNIRKIESSGDKQKIKLDNVYYWVHNLVANAFLENKYKNTVVVHIDKNRSNNDLYNLKWFMKAKKSTGVMIENNNYTISYHQKGKFHIYFEQTGKIEELDFLPSGEISNFSMLSVNDNHATDDDLLKYAKLFKLWNKELMNNEIVKINYAECYSDYTAVSRTFNRFCKKYYENHDPISPTEYLWFEKCPNSGQMYLKKDDTTVKCSSYDFKNQYGLTMSSHNLIPSKQGSEQTIPNLPKLSKDVQYGFYHVKISSDNDDFRKVFFFSKDNVYLDVSLRFAMKHRKKFNVKIELFQDSKPNCYLYKTEDMVTLNSITDVWFTKLTNLRKVYPDNKLLKHLISTAWGHMNAGNTKNKSWADIEKLGWKIGNRDTDEYKILEYYEYENQEYYVLLETKSPYKHNIRLKPWITAMSRELTASIALQNIDKVYRVQTDSVSFTEEMTFDNPNLVLEAKTTGDIHWKSVNCYHNLTTGYKSKGYDPKIK